MVEATQKQIKYIVIDTETRSVYSGYGNTDYSSEQYDVPYYMHSDEELKAYLLKNKTVSARQVYLITPVSYKKEVLIRFD